MAWSHEVLHGTPITRYCTVGSHEVLHSFELQGAECFENTVCCMVLSHKVLHGHEQKS